MSTIICFDFADCISNFASICIPIEAERLSFMFKSKQPTYGVIHPFTQCKLHQQKSGWYLSVGHFTRDVCWQLMSYAWRCARFNEICTPGRLSRYVHHLHVHSKAERNCSITAYWPTIKWSARYHSTCDIMTILLSIVSLGILHVGCIWLTGKKEAFRMRTFSFG